MELIVKPLKRTDTGRGLASADREAMADLGVANGEFVTIDGPGGSVVACVWPGGRRLDGLPGRHRTGRAAANDGERRWTRPRRTGGRVAPVVGDAVLYPSGGPHALVEREPSS